MRAPYEFLRFSWLFETEDDAAVFSSVDRDQMICPYPIPPEIGSASFTKVDMSMGMSIFRAEHRFQSAAVGKLIPIANVDGEFPTESLMIQVVKGGRIVHRESYPTGEVIFSPGFDLFRVADRLNLVPIVDGSTDSIMTCLTISRLAFCRLVGDNVADKTLNALKLLPAPKVVVKSMPLDTSSYLHNAIAPNLSGSIGKLYSQARALDYLSALIAHLGTNQEEVSTISVAKRRARNLFDQLTSIQGKLPTLEELADQYEVSARTLNNEFKAEFGQPIFAFIQDRRLIEARAAIEGTDIPLKELSLRLGYTHAHHFVSAFSKKFGNPPGRLRSNRKTPSAR